VLFFIELGSRRMHLAGCTPNPSSFDDVFHSEGIEILRTRFRAPQANGVAERFVRILRSECLDWLLIGDAPAPRATAIALTSRCV